MRKEEEAQEKPEEQARVKTDKPSRRPKIVETDEELEDNALLGESTLAKMSAAAEAATEVRATAEAENIAQKVDNQPVEE